MTSFDAELRTQLDLFEERLRQQEAPMARYLAPGLEAEQVRRLMDHLPFEMPAEVVTWFNWHNGTVWEWSYVYEDFPAGRFKDLREAQGDWAFWLQSREDWDLRERPFDPMWLPLIGGGNSFYMVDCSGGPTAPTPVLELMHDTGPQEWRELCAPSLTALVSLWNEALDRRLVWFDHEKQWWADDRANMPEEFLRVLG